MRIKNRGAIRGFKGLMKGPNQILKLLRGYRAVISKLLMFTEEGMIMFKVKLDHDRAILAYLLAKALLYGLGILDRFDAAIDELERLPLVDSDRLEGSLERFSHESELLLLTTDRGYCLNPDKDKIKAIIENLEDYLAVSGQAI